MPSGLLSGRAPPMELPSPRGSLGPIHDPVLEDGEDLELIWQACFNFGWVRLVGLGGFMG